MKCKSSQWKSLSWKNMSNIAQAYAWNWMGAKSSRPIGDHDPLHDPSWSRVY